MRSTLAVALALTASVLAFAPTVAAQDPVAPEPFSVVGKQVVKKSLTLVAVGAPTAGTVTLAQKAGKRKTLIDSVTDSFYDGGGEIVLRVKPNKAGRKLIGKKGKFTVQTTIVFTPADASAPQSISHEVKLKGKKKPKAKKKKAKKKQQPGIPGLPGYEDLLDALGLPGFGNGKIPGIN